ncbi:DUF4166 domain-containing protein [Streptomyces albidus (ex Kaewkla and Franco 2022)]|uniref:DUF4166 domain-containing protein n=1 Tax=Streptomyces albidus (ex Kaewkla and Franco 2022) TaxID=722709 RepID=UPI0015EE6BA3|nr:DUF4166 domain-containing protein [Streptomyces albidus (ex Kaewkla and Franco 2022)]
MSSIFQRALGSDFDRLHPRIQRRFSVGLDTGEACAGRGVMDRVWHGGPLVRPFLALGGVRNILVPKSGSDIPFTIENFPYTDSYGRETVTFVRTFAFPGRTRRFDATMVFSPERGCIVDYLGTHQHLATDLHFEADTTGAIVIRSGEHRFREGPLDVRVPDLIGGDTVVRESYDEEAGRFRIQVSVSNRRFGRLFGYDGSFTADYADASACGSRTDLRPVREEARA